MKIIITRSFEKELLSFWNINLNDIKEEIIKYNLWLNNFINLIDLDNSTKVLKWYLLSKKIRLIIVFKKVDNIYIPVFLFKKESKNWYNIRKNDDNFKKIILNWLIKINKDIIEKNYKEI